MIKLTPHSRRAHSRCAARPSRSPSSFLLLLCLIFAASAAQANVLIQRSITIDGNMGDWTQAPSILTNPGQFSTDARGQSQDCSTPIQPGEDLDCVVQTDHRDLRRFAFTFDNNYLYLYVERWVSASPQSGWIFYLDLEADGTMNSGDKVLQVIWQGNTGSTEVYLHDYVPADPAGDPLAVYNPIVDEVTADGYTMPGTVTNEQLLETNFGGQPGGLRMETRIRWDRLDPNANGPFSVGFHISSNRGGTGGMPGRVEDNMDGPGGAGGGSALIFADPFLTKTGPVNDVGLSGQPVAFTLTLGNNGPDTATGIEVTDRCEDQGFDSFHSHEASVGSYNPVSGIWSVDELAPGDTETLTLRCLIWVEADTVLTNTASITALGIADTNTDNNSDSATVTVVPVPELTMMKFSVVTWDPVNGSSQPKRIPGAWIDYTVKVVNSGFGNAETVEVTDILPAEVTLFTGDFAGSGNGPISFTPADSGLSYSYPADLELLDSNDNSIGGNGGFDPAVQRIRVSPQGTFLGSTAVLPATNQDLEFELRFRVRLD